MGNALPDPPVDEGSGTIKVRVNPYKALGVIYDKVMDHVDYNGWAEFVIDILRDYYEDVRITSDPIRLIECACGTGSLAIRLALSGLKITAFDKSEEMISRAKLKGAELIEPPEFRVGEFSSFSATERYNVCLCIYDSVNYLMDSAELQMYFARVYHLLTSDGIFIFDICTEYNSLSHFNNISDHTQGDGYHYLRVMKYDNRKKIQENEFTIRFNDQPKKLFIETHLQRIYSESTIRKEVKMAGFNILEVVDGFERDRVTKESLRIHFICRKGEEV